jgi:hypothetical protein
MKRFISFLLIFTFGWFSSSAQLEKRWIKHHIALLAGRNMEGRGYVGDGRRAAEKYIIHRFKDYGLVPVTADSSFTQDYYFDVNTFPGEMELKINKKTLVPGEDYLVDAASASLKKRRLKIKVVDCLQWLDTTEYKTAFFDPDYKWSRKKAYHLKNVDSFCKRTDEHPWHFTTKLGKGCFIIPEHGKMFWTVATEQMPATVFYVEDTVLPKKIKKVGVDVKAVFLDGFENRNKNIIACVPGLIKDSFIVFTAHYDHLGMMGSETCFPGASDNASGIAMLLYLADYFAKHPQHYTMVFIAFSGEEAGLLGSQYFVEHPLIPLENIKFLTNIDIMGDATDGVTVVNATEFPEQFALLQKINKDNNYLPQIKSRGKAANSDHYFFTQAGVPSFFIYSNGGPGYYHDVFDNVRSLPMTNIDRAAHLFTDFAQALNSLNP